MRVSEEHYPHMRVAYLRAALMDYVGMEEVLPVDIAARGGDQTPMKITDTANGMLVVLRELRHVQLHLVNAPLESRLKSAVFRAGEREIATEVEVDTIPTSDLCQILSLRNAARYETRSLEASIEWFDDAQRKWGVGDVLQAGIQTYAAAIVAKYQLPAP